MFVRIAANARTGQRVDGCIISVVMMVDCLEHTGVICDTMLVSEVLLLFAINCKLALTNTILSSRKGSTPHTHTGARPNDRKRID